MSYLRFLILKQSRDVVNKLNDVLSVFYSEWKVWIWSKEMSFTSFIRCEILDFIKNVDKIITLLPFHLAKSKK